MPPHVCATSQCQGEGAGDCCSSPCLSGAAGSTPKGGGGGAVGTGVCYDVGSSLLTVMTVHLTLCYWLKVLTHTFCWTLMLVVL